MNSVKHGCYSERPIAIPRGALAEDPEQVQAFIDEIIEDLRPRDLLERVAARGIAHLMLKTLRLSAFEAEAIAGGSSVRPGHGPPPNGFGREDHWDLLKERGAIDAINDVLLTTERISGTISLRLDRSLERYDKLKERDLDDEEDDDEDEDDEG